MKKYIGLLSVLFFSLSGCGAQGDHADKSNLSDQDQRQWVDLLSAERAYDWTTVGSKTLNPQWTLSEGVLSLTQSGGGDVTTGTSYQNFELRLEWNISKGGNSGIFYLANPNTNKIPVWTSALEMQILDDVNHPDNKTAYTRAGSGYGLYASRDGIAKPFGTWNAARIIVNDGHVEHWLNGEKIIEFDIRSDDFKDRVARSKFNDYSDVFAQSSQGLIVLQDHQDPVSFRNIQIRELK